MTYQQFLDENRYKLLGYFILAELSTMTFDL